MDPRRAENLEADVQIGDFRIERRIGAGGMGVVYLARQVSLDRPVALKILGGALDRDQDILRFQREAQAVARLHHPGIAGIHFIGQDRQACYLAMEMIEGVSLRSVIQRLAVLNEAGQTLDAVNIAIPIGEGEARVVRFDDPTVTFVPESESDGTKIEPGTISPEAKRLRESKDHIRRCCEIVRDAASALAHAHERGVVHRDIKPENILLDRQGRPHLIDFGVARFFEDVSLTNTGALVGTPMYMSPEQVAGRFKLDHRTDLYSLGLVLYELLTLTRPVEAATREGILLRIVTKAMSPVSWANPTVPRDLEGVIHKAIAKDPDDRYQNASDFAVDLQAWLEGRPVQAGQYRYRFDEREIIAERPSVVVFVGLVYYFGAFYNAFFVLQGLLSGAFYPLPLCLGTLAAIAGNRLMAGRAWAKRLVSWLNLGFGLLIFGNMLHLRDLVRSGGGREVIIQLIMQITFLATYILCSGFLSLPSVSSWFRLAKRIHSEHEQQAASHR